MVAEGSQKWLRPQETEVWFERRGELAPQRRQHDAWAPKGPGTRIGDSQASVGRGNRPWWPCHYLHVTSRPPSVNRPRKTASSAAVFGCWVTVSSLKCTEAETYSSVGVRWRLLRSWRRSFGLGWWRWRSRALRGLGDDTPKAQ
ncbi:hypothetical protein BJX62DRAFT_132442 [Aspergillus germanicus]